MKVTFTLLLLTLSLASAAQDSDPRIQTLINQLDSVKIKADTAKKQIISNRAFNIFFAKKINSYLSGTNDLSLYKNYAIVDAGDSRLSFGYNFTNKVDKSDGFVRAIYTIGAEVNTKSKLSTIFGDGDFSEDLGITAKFTLLGKGFVKFYEGKQTQKEFVAKRQKPIVIEKRNILLCWLEAKIKADEKRFKDSIHAYVSDTELLQEARNEYYGKTIAKYKDIYASRESEFLELKKTYNLLFDHWLSVNAYIPITPTTYNVFPTLNSKKSAMKSWPYRIGLQWSFIFESRFGKLFGNASVNFAGFNSVKADTLKKLDYDSFKKLGGTDSLQFLMLVNNDAGYYGVYNNFNTIKYRLQLIYFTPWTDIVGLSIVYEDVESDIYRPKSYEIGLPVKIAGKEKPINIQPFVRVFDFKNEVKPNKSLEEKMTIGVTIGLPFSSILY
ncbi:MAG: hypothetical protein HOP30_21245 [Cyclobacteriaceae bacterium]|nr:hypothetical protein [Cyclobacteriaceae bacterium]